MQLYIYLFAALFTALPVSSADDPLYEKVWGAVVYTLHGDSTLHGLNEPRNLTSLGANQLYDAGNSIRNHYVRPRGSEDTAGESGQITGISEGSLVGGEVELLSTTEQAVSASALAFTQGLYPPAAEAPDGDSNYVNGSLIHYPLSGYQYPALTTVGDQDPASIHVAGHTSCPSYTWSILHWAQSWQGRRTRAVTDPFYEDLYNRVLNGVLAKEDANYYNAPYIFDCLNYEHIHNETARNIISQDDLDHARFLADEHVYGANANFSTVGFDDQRQNINAVAGMTLADYVIEALERNIHTQGASNKLSLLFGRFEPMVSFSALLGLPSNHQPNFYGRPNPGASMIIELFSMESDLSASYPQSDTDFMVRFLLRNGTSHSGHLSTPVVPYPMFGHSPGQSAIPYKEFLGSLIDFRVSVSTWCRICSSPSIFCPVYTGVLPNGTGSRENGGSSNVYKVLVGVLGGLLGAILLVFLFYCCCGSSRRKQKNNTAGYSQPVPAGFSSLPKQPESFEMTSSSNKSSTRHKSPGVSLHSLSREDDDDELLVSPAAQPVVPRETV